MIEAIDLTVRRHGRTLLDAVSFDVRPGQVTGVLGGTGAGKTMLLRRMVELERGRGETLFDGRPYSALRRPMREVGLLLDPAVGDPDRTVRSYLRLALATDRGAAREGTLANARSASGPQRGIAGPDAAACRDGAETQVKSRRQRKHEADATGRGNGTDALDSVGRQHETDAQSRTTADLNAAADSLGIDVAEDAEFARALGARDGRRNEDGRRDGQVDHGGAPSAHTGKGDLENRIEATRRGRPKDRIEAVLDIVGLTEQSRTRLSDLTEGMATRLGIAVALLGDPQTLLLDCPDRDLEPEGVAWLGSLLRAFTAQGRAALVTGSDTETLIGMVDRVLLLDSGYLVGTRTAEEVLRAPTGASVVVRSPQIVRFAAILAEAGARSTQGEGACLEVRGLDRARVGDLAYRHNIPVHELSDRFTGSDPGDLVLAACTGRRTRPVVPIQGFPDGKRVVGVPTPVTVGASTTSSGLRSSGVKSWGAKALRPARVGGAELGAPVSNVRVMDVEPVEEPSVRLISVVPEPVGHGEMVERAPSEGVVAEGVASGGAAPDVNAGDAETQAAQSGAGESQAAGLGASGADVAEEAH